MGSIKRSTYTLVVATPSRNQSSGGVDNIRTYSDRAGASLKILPNNCCYNWRQYFVLCVCETLQHVRITRGVVCIYAVIVCVSWRSNDWSNWSTERDRCRVRINASRNWTAHYKTLIHLSLNTNQNYEIHKKQKNLSYFLFFHMQLFKSVWKCV